MSALVDESMTLPLFSACATGDVEELKLLLSKVTIDINYLEDKSGDSLLNVAIKNKHLEIMKVLMASGFDGMNDDLLNLAVETGVIEIVQFFEDHVSLFYHKLGDAYETACAEGNMEIVNYLYCSGVDITESNALFYAAAGGHPECVEDVINAGAKVNPWNDYFFPLFPAASAGHEKVVDILINARADLRREDPEEGPIMILAAKGGCVSLTKRMLAKHPTDYAQIDGALWTAAGAGKVDVIQAILEHDSEINECDNSTPLTHALEGGHLAAVQVLMKAGSSITKVNEDGKTVLMSAAQGGCADFVGMLLARGANVNAATSDGLTALAHASDPATVRRLLDARAEVNPTGRPSVMLEACKKAQPVSVKMMLSAGAKADGFANNALIKNAILATCPPERADDKLVLVKMLIDAGARIDDVKQKSFAMHLCVESSDPGKAAVAAMLPLGPTTLTDKNRYGSTPLVSAVNYHFHEDIVPFLVSVGANVNDKTPEGDSVLMRAIDQYPPIRYIDDLIQAGADVNAKDARGKSVLQRVLGHTDTRTSQRRWKATLRMLLDTGANPRGLNSAELTLLMNSVQGVRLGSGDNAVIDLLHDLVNAAPVAGNPGKGGQRRR